MNKRTRQHQQDLYMEILRWEAIKHEFNALPIRYVAVERRMGLPPKKLHQHHWHKLKMVVDERIAELRDKK